MKRIIDVPKEVYEALKSITEDATSLDPYSLADIIVNKSKPLDDSRPQGEWKHNNIDNAPIVETYTKDDLTREYLKGYNDCKDMNGRSQGEWIKDDWYDLVCSNCGGVRRDNRVDHINYCNKCGADMRKRSGEDNGKSGSNISVP